MPLSHHQSCVWIDCIIVTIMQLVLDLLVVVHAEFVIVSIELQKVLSQELEFIIHQQMHGMNVKRN